MKEVLGRIPGLEIPDTERDAILGNAAGGHAGPLQFNVDVISRACWCAVWP